MLTRSLSIQANDATACLNDLARKGAAGVRCVIAKDQGAAQMCRIGGARIISSSGTSAAQGANW